MKLLATLSAIVLAIASSGADAANSWWKPKPGTSYEIQLAGTLNLTYNVAMYDIDLFDTPTATITKLHNRGIKVICYFSAGTYENWRPDKAKYTKAMIGSSLPEWEGEYWVDTTNKDLRAILKTRMQLAKTKGCDGVDPDNVDGAFNDPGFPLTAATQLDFNKFLASTAHSLNLTVGLKNDLDQVKDLVSVFDFAVNEQCVANEECAMLDPFIKANKPVFGIEYDGNKKTICAEANKRNFDTLYKSWDLRGDRYACR